MNVQVPHSGDVYKSPYESDGVTLAPHWWFAGVVGITLLISSLIWTYVWFIFRWTRLQYKQGGASARYSLARTHYTLGKTRQPK